MTISSDYSVPLPMPKAPTVTPQPTLPSTNVIYVSSGFYETDLRMGYNTIPDDTKYYLNLRVNELARNLVSPAFGSTKVDKASEYVWRVECSFSDMKKVFSVKKQSERKKIVVMDPEYRWISQIEQMQIPKQKSFP